MVSQPMKMAFPFAVRVGVVCSLQVLYAWLGGQLVLT